jgi:hypothetical protein
MISMTVLIIICEISLFLGHFKEFTIGCNRSRFNGLLEVLFIMAFLARFVEGFIIKSTLQTALEEKIRIMNGLLIISLLFCLMYGTYGLFVGLIFGYFFQKYGSLPFITIAHGTMRYTNVILLLCFTFALITNCEGSGEILQNYSVLINMNSQEMVAIDNSGNIIAQGIHGTDDTKIIQSSIDHITHRGGRLVLNNIDSRVSTLIINDDDMEIIGINSTLRQIGREPIFAIGQQNMDKDYIDSYFISSKLKKDVYPKNAYFSENIYKTSITVVTPPNLSKGDWILLGSDKVYAYSDRSYPFQGEIRKVLSIEPDSIIVDGKLFDSYKTFDNSKVFKIKKMIKNINICGINLIGHDEVDSYGIKAGFVIGLNLKNINLTGFKKSAIYLVNCINASLETISISHSNQDGYGYGLAFCANCRSCIASNISGDDCRHVVTFASEWTYGVPRDCWIKDVSAKNGHLDAAIDTHTFCENIKYENITIDSFVSVANMGGIGCIYKNIIAANISTAGIVAYNNESPENVYSIIDNASIDLSGTGCAFSMGNSNRNIIIKDCIFKNIGRQSYLSGNSHITIDNCTFYCNKREIIVLILDNLEKSPFNSITIKNCKFIGGDNNSQPFIKIKGLLDTNFKNIVLNNCWFGQTSTYALMIKYINNSSHNSGIYISGLSFKDNLGALYYSSESPANLQIGEVADKLIKAFKDEAKARMGASFI